MRISWFVVLTCLCVSVSALNLGDLHSMFVDNNAQTETNSYSNCKADLVRMASNIQSREIRQMLDSFGKLGSGVLNGNFYFLGSENECLKAYVPESNNFFLPLKAFRGKFCYLLFSQLGAKGPFGIPIGSCIPDSCEEADILSLYPLVMSILKIQYPRIQSLPQSVVLKSVECYNTKKPYTTLTKVSMCVLSVPLLLVILATTADYISSRLSCSKKPYSLQLKIWRIARLCSQCRLQKYLMCFSALKNGRAILRMDEKQEELSFIHGIKLICMLWLTVGHVHILGPVGERNALDRLRYNRKLFYQVNFQAIYAVDTMFFISGFLLMFASLKSVKRSLLGFKTIVMALIHRYLRLFLPMFFTTILAVNVLQLFNDSFKNNYRIGGTYDCKEIWWSFPLLISNLFEASKSCCAWLWYVSADFQLFAVGLIVVAIAQRSTMWARRLAILLTLTTSFIGLAIIVHYNFSTVQGTFELMEKNTTEGISQGKETFRLFVVRPYARGEGFWVGLLFSIFLHTNITARLPKFSAKSRFQLIVACVSIFTYILYYPLYGPRTKVYQHSMAFSCRILWSSGLGLLFYLCLRDPKGLVCRVLSCSLWAPLGRLSYCQYLMHINIINHVLWSADQPITFTYQKSHAYAAGFIVTSYVCAFFISLLYEAPFLNLLKLLLQRRKE